MLIPVKKVVLAPYPSIGNIFSKLKFLLFPIKTRTIVINKIGNFFGIRIGGNTHSLSSFSKKKGVMRNEDLKKSLPFIIDKEDEIHPIIPIDEYISADENGDFKRNDLKSLCDNFLEKIKLEIYGFEHK